MEVSMTVELAYLRNSSNTVYNTRRQKALEMIKTDGEGLCGLS